MSSFLNKYLISSCIFTSLYKLYETQNVKIKREETNEITRLLAGERLLIISYNIIISPIASPFYFADMLNVIDNKLNNVVKIDDKPKTFKEILN